MAVATTTYSWASNAQGWTKRSGTNDVASWQSGDGSPANGCMQSRLTGKKLSESQAGWSVDGGTVSWESLGVPAGATVTSVSGSANWRCSEYSTAGASNYFGALAIQTTSYGALIALLTNDQAPVSGTTGWTGTGALGEVSVDAAYQASNTLIMVDAQVQLSTGNSSGAAVAMRIDQYVVNVTYTTGGPTPKSLAYADRRVARNTLLRR